MFSKLKLRHALFGLVAIPFFIAIQGCDDRQAVGTVATIGVVGGALTVGSYSNDYYYNCNGYYGCGYYDRRGYYYRNYPNYGYGRGYNRGYDRGYRRISNVTPEQVTQEEQATEDLNNTASLAARYGITMEAASTLKHTLRTTVENDSLQPVYDLGLSSSDLLNISQSRDISESSLQKVSSKLGLTVEQTRAAVRQMMADAQQNPVTESL